MSNKEIEFAQDTEERRRWFRAASFSHPAKMVLGLQIYLIEHYTKPGETILDPMAGSGTVLVGCALGCNIVCVELEEKFVKMQQDNWDKIKSLGPMLGYKMGEATILQGDARQLDKLLVDKCIFSPPYADNTAKINGTEKFWQERERKWGSRTASPRRKEIDSQDYGKNPHNIANLKYGEISAVISSPPYESTLAGNDNMLQPNGKGVRKSIRKSTHLSKYADAVITSPPYEESLSKKHRSPKTDKLEQEKKLPVDYTGLDESIKRLRKHGRTDPKAGGAYGKSLAHPYSPAAENIGNLKSGNYLEAMLAVYRQCHQVLKDGGLLCLVVKNFIRDKKIVRLDLDTIKLCKKAGFVLKERLKRKLTHQSFWRILYQKKFPDAPKIEFEDILIFAKAKPDAAVER